MKTKSLLLTLLLVVSILLSACAKETESTVSGMVVKKEGTVIYLLEFNSINISESRPTGDDPEGSRPSRPDKDTDGSRPSRPEGDFNPDDTDGSRPSRPDREFNTDESQLTKLDIADAHISIEIDEGKEAGTIDDIKEGSRVTITLKGDKPTNVLISSNSRNGKGFGKGNREHNNENN